MRADVEHVDNIDAELAAIEVTGYEGWVVWLFDEDDPIFEAHDEGGRGLFQIRDRTRRRAHRPESRRVMDWKTLRETVPHHRIRRLALFFARGRGIEQPRVFIDRLPGDRHAHFRFFQMKSAGVTVSAVGDGMGQERTGIVSYRIGVWDPKAGGAHMVEVTRTGKEHHQLDGGHPCWPKPFGWGFAPFVLGLTEADVPEPPVGLAPLPERVG